jgi:serine acetyltransferase
VIIGDVVLADKSIVGAGAVVVKSNAIVGAKLAGVPAKPI